MTLNCCYYHPDGTRKNETKFVSPGQTDTVALMKECQTLFSTVSLETNLAVNFRVPVPHSCSFSSAAVESWRKDLWACITFGCWKYYGILL